jgi:hypothetical protein
MRTYRNLYFLYSPIAGFRDRKVSLWCPYPTTTVVPDLTESELIEFWTDDHLWPQPARDDQ